jgi:DNA-binding transcriptional LysR family regulator
MIPAGYRYFHALAQERSIRNAADRAHISPSAMSRQIALLEEELGEKLLERRARGVVVTGAGRVLLDHIRRLMQMEQELRHDLSELSGMRTGHLCIAMGNGFASSVAPLVSKFAAEYPQVRFTVNVSATDETVRAVEEEEVELGLLVSPPSNPMIEVVDTLPIPLLAVVPAKHPLTRSKAAVPLTALESERLALLRPSHGIRQILQRVELQEGLKLSPYVESNSYEVLRSCVVSGLGVTILPRISVAEELRRRRVAVVPLDHPVLRATSAAVVKRRTRKLSAAAREFMKHIQSEFGAPVGR